MLRSDPPVGDGKPAWRAWAAELAPHRASEAVTRGLAAWPPFHGVVATYLAMNDEVDLAGLENLDRCRFLVPRVEEGGHLTLHDLDRSQLVLHRYGFLEPPITSEPVSFDAVDVVLVPGRAFDRSGVRLGRGAGMYDRLLATLPAGVVRIGVSIDEGVVADLPHELHDQRVDWLATESGVFTIDRDLARSTQQVVDAAIERGLAPAMVRFPEGTKTSADAARAVGADLGAIAKSLVFLVDDRPVIVICSGDHRVDEAKLCSYFGASEAVPAPLDRVREATGYVAGGTPAVGHRTPMQVVADVTLARYRWLWSAGGTPDTVYPVSLARLVAASEARWADVSIRG